MGRLKASCTIPGRRVLPIKLDLPEGRIEAEIDLPLGFERLVVITFKMLTISSTVTDMGTEAARRLGLEISCKKGCGTCCRQLVPLSPPEAAMVFEFVESMPEARKSELTNRFSLAVNQLQERGFLDRLESVLQNSWKSDEEYDAIASEYFLQQVPCPFLVNECCSIYEVRPSMCREYVVTSPPENCKNPHSSRISRLPISVRLSEALARTWASLCKEEVKVVPLVLALNWTRENERTRLTGTDSVELLTTILGHITDIATKRAQEVTERLKD